jgi:hypothetical protein
MGFWHHSINVAAVIDDIVEGFEDLIRQPVLTPLGTHSSTNPGKSRDATGQQSVTQSEDWYYFLLQESRPADVAWIESAAGRLQSVFVLT